MDHTRNASLGVSDGNFNVGNITNSYNTTSSYNTAFDWSDEEDRRIMQWLSPLEPQNRHDGVRSERLEGVNWVLETNEFREWRSGEGGADKAVLFCHGNPGVGKTYLNCLVMDHLYDRAREEEITVAGVYCDFREQQEQTTVNMIGAIHKQLVLKSQGILEPVRTEFLMAKKESGRRPQLADHVRMLRTAISSLPQVFLCFDALDEFTTKKLPELLVSLREIIREIPSVRMFFTGRPQVEGLVTRYFDKAIMIPISPNPNDVEKYVERKLEMDIELHAMNDTLRADVRRTIREKEAENFLLVSLVINAILAEPTISDRREKLNEMTKGGGLEDAYTITLAPMKAQSGSRPRLGLEALEPDPVESYRLNSEYNGSHIRYDEYPLGWESEKGLWIGWGYREQWIVGEVLGRGGNSVVRKHQHKKTGRVRAVKTIEKSGYSFHAREFNIMTILNKPEHRSRFVEFLGWFENRDRLFIAMEYFEQGDLRKHLDEPLGKVVVQIITMQVLNGLQVMHANNIAHRDLKPDNIFVVSMSPVWVKLGDFGISKRIHGDTSYRSRVCTDYYAAPEVLGIDTNSETSIYTNAVDMWSLGCVVYELLAGEKLFSSLGQIMAFFYNKGKFPEQKFKELAAPLSDAVESFIQGLVLLDPDNRPSAVDAASDAWLQRPDYDHV